LEVACIAVARGTAPRLRRRSVWVPRVFDSGTTEDFGCANIKRLPSYEHRRLDVKAERPIRLKAFHRKHLELSR